ncbi:MAG: hypothetical protein RM347_015715 [Nostoc sp. ChiQUE02]|uniref:hypothetical protein n=1 Tax=Nostoc sp. ChiQUE02 TaxID=3075377 RepID=UPI002AD3468D|nr:hypothetical protein [Nostoc sp. ChiQUE02]
METFYGLKVVTVVTLTPRIILGKTTTPAIATKYPIEAKRFLFRGGQLIVMQHNLNNKIRYLLEKLEIV